MKVVMVLLVLLNSHTRCSEGNGSIGFPVVGSFAALEIITWVPSAETASTLPIGTGEISCTAFVVVSNVARPLLVPMKPGVPARSNSTEVGNPGRKIGEPATGGVLLVSIGIMVMLVPGTFGKVLVA